MARVLSTGHGQAADPEQVLVDYYHCSGRKVFGDLAEVGENDRCLLGGPAPGQAADEDHRRIASPGPGQETTEIGVGGDQDLTAGAGALEDCFVGRCVHAEVAYVDGVVAGRLQYVCQERGEVVVDEEFHAVRRSGSSRSRTASAAYRSD